MNDEDDDMVIMMKIMMTFIIIIIMIMIIIIIIIINKEKCMWLTCIDSGQQWKKLVFRSISSLCIVSMHIVSIKNEM